VNQFAAMTRAAEEFAERITPLSPVVDRRQVVSLIAYAAVAAVSSTLPDSPFERITRP
jgi:hypothetical protein